MAHGRSPLLHGSLKPLISTENDHFLVEFLTQTRLQDLLIFCLLPGKDKPWQYPGMTNTTDMKIRSPVTDDVPGVIEVVGSCKPSLLVYRPYYYWMNIRYFADTCAVAEHHGHIIGWCSIISAPRNRFFLHQLGVKPDYRGQKVAFRLVQHLLRVLTAKGDIDLELTIERNNTRGQVFFANAAESVGLALKLVEVIPLLEQACNEDVYAIAKA